MSLAKLEYSEEEKEHSFTIEIELEFECVVERAGEREKRSEGRGQKCLNEVKG